MEKVLTMYGAEISVFDDGSIWIHRGSRNKRRFGNTTDKGYKSVLIRDNGRMRTVFVHRLVAMAFVPNPQNKPQVNHKDGNKQNNRPDNLEWVTLEENMKHRAEILKSYKKTPVRCIETGEVFASVSEASMTTGVSRANINRSAKCLHKPTRGLHWEFMKGGD